MAGWTKSAHLLLSVDVDVFQNPSELGMSNFSVIVRRFQFLLRSELDIVLVKLGLKF